MSLRDETEVDKDEFIAMACRASAEIKALRAQIQILIPKAQAFDSIAMILGMMRQPSQGMTEDLAFLLDRRVAFFANQTEAAVVEDAEGPTPPSANVRGKKNTPPGEDQVEGDPAS